MLSILLTDIMNVALRKNANQSSTSHDRVAQRAVDGIWESDMTAFNSCSHTWPYNTTYYHNETSPWWEVDLEKVYTVQRVKILNRSKICLNIFPILRKIKSFYNFHEY